MPRTRTTRQAVEPWRSIQVVPAATTQEAAEAMRRAIHVLAEPFKRWAAERQDVDRQPAHPPSEVSPP